MQVTFLCTNSEKYIYNHTRLYLLFHMIPRFAYAYAMEKAILTRSIIYVYGGVEELTKRLGELRWLLVGALRSKEIDVELINERVQFRVIESTEEAFRLILVPVVSVEFHVFPSKKLKTLSDYVEFLIGLQKSGDREIVIIDDVIRAFDVK